MELKQGYKMTEVGVIPEDWEVKPLSQIAKRITRGASPRPIDNPIWFDSRSSVGWVRISDVTRSGRYLCETSQRLSEEGIRRSRPVPSGSLIMSICATVGRPIETRLDTCIHDGFVVFDQPSIDQSYLYHVLSALEPTWSKHGQTGSQMNLNTGLINGCLIPLPPTETEQRAIAAALSDVDALLSGLDQLIAKKRDIKQAAMQQLLTGKTRLPGFSGEWEVRRLGDLLGYEQPNKYLVKSSEYSDANDTPVLTAGKTFILGYTDEVDGIFNDLPVIIFDDFTTATKYVTFPFKAKSSAMKFLKPRNSSVNLRLVYEMMQVIEFALSEHKRYWISEFQELEIKMPNDEEQKAIVKVLSDIDTELSALEARRDKTRAIKQAMMQELLTGKTRLVGDKVLRSEEEVR